MQDGYVKDEGDYYGGGRGGVGAADDNDDGASGVIVEVVMDLHSCATSLAREWDEVGEFDNLFLICVDAARRANLYPGGSKSALVANTRTSALPGPGRPYMLPDTDSNPRYASATRRTSSSRRRVVVVRPEEGVESHIPRGRPQICSLGPWMG